MNQQTDNNRTWMMVGILVTVVGGFAAIVIIAVAVFIFNATAPPDDLTPTAVSAESSAMPAATEEPTQPLIRTRAPTGVAPTALPLPSTGGSGSVGGGGSGGGSTYVESPQQSVVNYYRDITAENYESAWEQLTDDFKQAFNCCAPNYDYEGYLGWWTTVDRVDFGEVRLVEQNGDNALVYADLIYTMEDGGQFEDSDPYIELEYSSTQGRWLFADKRADR